MPLTHPHGTVPDPKKQHPVLDIRHWISHNPLEATPGQGGWVDHPGGVARFEQGRNRASKFGPLGASVPSDVFVWADTVDRERPWLTQLGGRPWREKKKPWPKDENGVPLAFLGQISFVDSKDVLPFELPGELALIFGTFSQGYAGIVNGGALEWSRLELNEREPHSFGIPWTGQLPYEYQGVVHRTVQYTDRAAHDPHFQKAGYKDGGWGVASVQATSIGTHANLPQGWPFEEGDGNTLVAVLSSFYFRGDWPLVDVPSTPKKVFADGREFDWWNEHALQFGVGDAGCIYIYRDKKGIFHMDETSA